jgi:biopolymer transport protein ExbD
MLRRRQTKQLNQRATNVAIRGYIRRRRRKAERFIKPNITSLADVTLVLLVIFLVSASAAVEMAVVELPSDAENAESRDLNLAVTITISNQKPKDAGDKGKVAAPKDAAPAVKPPKADAKKATWLFYFEDDHTGIELKNLWTALTKIKRDPKTGKAVEWPLVVIRADKSAPGQHLTVLVQCLSSLGVDTIAFAIQNEKSSK